MSHPVRTLRVDVADRPFIVIWEVTRACALACAHCRADAVTRRDPLELSTSQGRALLDSLAEYEPPRPMVVLTGGDPFERPDLVDLVAHGTAQGLHVSLAPSVTARLTAPSLEALRGAGASAVSLSLDGATAATHDSFRGIDGTFDATLAAARSAHEAGLRLQVNTTVTGSNVLELPAVFDLLTELQVSLWSVFFLVPTGRGGSLRPLAAGDIEDVLGWLHDISNFLPVKATEAPHFRRIAIQRASVDDPDAVWPPGPLRTELRRRTAAGSPTRSTRGRQARAPLDVNAGRGFVFVDHRGMVQPSGFLPVDVGSVVDDALPNIYRDAPLLRRLRDPDALGGRCGRCEFRAICGGSRSRAFAATGDPLAEDPGCAYEPAADGPTGWASYTSPSDAMAPATLVNPATFAPNT